MIVLYNNNKKSIIECNIRCDKTSRGIIEGSLSIIEFKRIVKSLRIKVSIEYAKENLKIKQFTDDLLSYLINKCYQQAELIRQALEQKEIQPNM